jgi:hypothetical protein
MAILTQYPQDHFRRTGRPLQYPTVFCVQAGKAKFKFPMEFCNLLPGQQFKKPTVDGDLTTAILKHTPKDPRERLKLIVDALRSSGVLNYQDGNNYLSQAGISIDPSPLKISGTVLRPLQMTFQERTDIVCLLEYTNREAS